MAVVHNKTKKNDQNKNVYFKWPVKKEEEKHQREKTAAEHTGKTRPKKKVSKC